MVVGPTARDLQRVATASLTSQGRMIEISFAEFQEPISGTIAVGIWEGGELTAPARRLDESTGGAVARALAASPRFTGKKSELLPLLGMTGTAASRIVLAGLGKPDALDARRLQDLGGALVAQLNAAGETEATAAIDSSGAAMDPAEAAAHLAYGAELRAYRFEKYRTRQKPEQKASLTRLAVAAASPEAARRAWEPLGHAAAAIGFARDLVSEPGNVIYPETLAAAAESLAELGVTVDVLDEARMAALGMNAMLAVGHGSVRPPRMVTMEWHGGRSSEPGEKFAAPLAFVGKGVTFDTGGISIKPAAGMEEMKWDMAGSAVVIGLMRLLAARKAKVNAVGIVGLTENMPSGSATRPGDIVASMSGQTIEIVNTDAEGRLVLADALSYCQDRFKPRLIVDLATLTGAIIVALGNEQAGLFSNDDALAGQLIAAGEAAGERVWRMPLGEAYDRDIDTEAADMKNVGSGRGAGSIIGAQFLQRFVTGVPWAHLDIAGVAWSKKDAPTVPKGATGFGIRLLDRFVAENYEAGQAG